MSPITRRRRPSPFAAGGRLGLGLLLVSLVLASTEGFLFKRRRSKGIQQPGASGKAGKSRGGKRGKVKDDVAWLLEDTSDGTWKPVRDDGRVQVWKRSMPNSDFVAIKSKASLAVSPQALFEVLTPGDIEIVRQYNPLVEDGSDLEVIDRDNKVSWSATMGIWPCRPRDFVTHIRRATLDDGSVAIVNSATTHAKAPVTGKYVRGEILHGVFHIKPSKNKKHSEFTMVHHFNPGGNIPPWLINWLAEGKPAAFVRKIEEVAGKWDKQVAQAKSMPCKGRGFGDKPCAFLLSPTDTSHEADGLAAGTPAADRGWPGFLATLTMAALLCGGWVVCFGRPALSEKKHSPAAETEGKGSIEKNGSSPGVDASRALPATRDTRDTPLHEQQSSEHEEVPAEEAGSAERSAKRNVGDNLDGEAQDVAQPDVEVPNGEVRKEVPQGEEPDGEVTNGDAPAGQHVSVEEGHGGKVPNGEAGSEPVDRAHVSGEGEGSPPSAPTPAATATTAAAATGTPRATAAEGEMPEENGTLTSASPSPQEEPATVVLDGDKVSNDSPEGQAACAARISGGVGDSGETGGPEPNGAVGAPDAGEVASARREGGGVATAGGVGNGEVFDRNDCRGEAAGLETSSGKADIGREFRENSLFLFGDKPFESSIE